MKTRICLKSLNMYLKDLNSWRIHHNPHSSAHCGGRKILGKLGSDRSSITMCAGNLTPNNTQVWFLGLSGDGSLVLGLKYSTDPFFKIPFKKQHQTCHSYPVNIGDSLSNIPGSISLAFTTFDTDKSCVFVLVPQTALKAGEDSFGVQSSWWRCHYCSRLKRYSINILHRLGFLVAHVIWMIL